MPLDVAPPPHNASPDELRPKAASATSSADVSLLPAALAHPAAFLWLWTLPLTVLLLLNVSDYTLIEGSMTAAQRGQAIWFGAVNSLNALAGVGLFFFSRALAARGASAATHLIVRTAPALGIQIVYLAVVLFSDDLVPRSVAPWIYSGGRFTFQQFSFAMLPLSLGVLQLACVRRAEGTQRAVAVNFGVVLGLPLLLFAAGHALRSFAEPAALLVVAFAIFLVTLGVAMVVGLVRLLVLALRGAYDEGPIAQRLLILFVAFVLPMAGLLLNRGIPFPVDLQSREVYGLTLVNAVVLLVASGGRVSSPRFRLVLLSAALPFSLYFFLVFLPYAPLAIPGVLFFGAGLLVLAPTLLLVLHLHQLHRARTELAGQEQRRALAAAVFSFLLLPGAFFWRAAADKIALDAALRYVHTPTISAGDMIYPGDVSELRRALDSHRSYKQGVHYPLLSDFYSWWVFNHLTLPDDKLTHLEEIFFGHAAAGGNTDPLRGPLGAAQPRMRARMPRAIRPPTDSVTVSELAVQTRVADAHAHTVSLALTLHNSGPAAGEYVKQLPLPAGVFVHGFRLHVNGEPVPGRIFEKKTALWIYTMIRDSERRDPGVLFYNSPEQLELRVFPIPARGDTRVEIDFLVPGAPPTGEEPSSPTHDPAAVVARLGQRTAPQLTRRPAGSLLALGAAARDLPLVEREPYLHLIVDRSAAHGYRGDFSAALRQLRAQFPDARRVRVTAANYDIIDLVPELTPFDQLPALDFTALRRPLTDGGLALDLALAHGIRRHRDRDLDRPGQGDSPPPRPIFVLLAADATARSLKDLKVTGTWLDLLPAFELHALGANGRLLTVQSAASPETPLVRLGNSIRPAHATRAAHFGAAAIDAPLRFWSPDRREWLPLDRVTLQPLSTAWSHAAALALDQQEFDRSPGAAPFDRAAVVRASRESGVLLPQTSYIVVENAAQWRMLERSEEQKLSQDAALVFLETPAPPFVWLALGFGAWLALAHRRRRRRGLTAGVP